MSVEELRKVLAKLLLEYNIKQIISIKQSLKKPSAIAKTWHLPESSLTVVMVALVPLKNSMLFMRLLKKKRTQILLIIVIAQRSLKLSVHPDWEEEIGKIKNTEMDELLHIIDRVGCLYASSEYADIYFEDVPALVSFEISEYDGTKAVCFI